MRAMAAVLLLDMASSLGTAVVSPSVAGKKQREAGACQSATSVGISLSRRG